MELSVREAEADGGNDMSMCSMEEEEAGEEGEEGGESWFAPAFK